VAQVNLAKGYRGPEAEEVRGVRKKGVTDTVTLCQIVSLSSWLHSVQRKIRTSESPSGPVTTAIRGISAPQRQSGKSLEGGASTRLNFDIAVPSARVLQTSAQSRSLAVPLPGPVKISQETICNLDLLRGLGIPARVAKIQHSRSPIAAPGCRRLGQTAKKSAQRCSWATKTRKRFGLYFRAQWKDD
jgi:hypothetical protein